MPVKDDFILTSANTLGMPIPTFSMLSALAILATLGCHAGFGLTAWALDRTIGAQVSVAFLNRPAGSTRA